MREREREREFIHTHTHMYTYVCIYPHLPATGLHFPVIMWLSLSQNVSVSSVVPLSVYICILRLPLDKERITAHIYYFLFSGFAEFLPDH